MSNWKGTLQSCLVSITAIFDTQISSAILNGHLMLSLHPAVETLSSSSTCILQILCVVSNRSCGSFPSDITDIEDHQKTIKQITREQKLNKCSVQLYVLIQWWIHSFTYYFNTSPLPILLYIHTRKHKLKKKPASKQFL